MKNFLNKYNLGYRIQQFIILILHLILLYWMYYTLAQSGRLSTSHVLYHFAGMSVMGALLIRGTAFWASYHFKKEMHNKNKVVDNNNDNDNVNEHTK